MPVAPALPLQSGGTVACRYLRDPVAIQMSATSPPSQGISVSWDAETPCEGGDVYNSPAHLPNLSLPHCFLSKQSHHLTLRVFERLSFTISPTQFAMEAGGSNSSGAATLAVGTSMQAELLALLEKFVHLMASSAMTDLQDLPEVCGRTSGQSPQGI